jgi:signal recognition particle subunit SRP54
MVLAELGGKLRDSLRKLQSSTVGGGSGNSGGGGNKGVTAADLQAVLSDISRALIEADVNVKLVLKLRDNVKKKVEHLLNKEDEETTTAAAAASSIRQNRNSHQVAKLVQRTVIDELTALLQPPQKASSSSSGGGSTGSKSKAQPAAYQMQRGKPNVILFVGLQGAGKTTTIAKYAHYYQKRGWKCAMVCADTFRAGALDQLKQNATKLRIPFYGSYAEADPVVIASAGVAQFRAASYEVIIVDTSGRHKQEASLLEEMQEIAQAVAPNNTILVMDATQGQAVYDQAAAFDAAVSVGSVIVTKLDGHAKGGGALSAVAATQSPVIFTGTGEHFDDLDPFDAESFVSKLLGFGDLKGLMQAMNDNGDGKKQEEFMEKVSKGEFTLRDMYNHFEKLLNMGVR